MKERYRERGEEGERDGFGLRIHSVAKRTLSGEDETMGAYTK